MGQRTAIIASYSTEAEAHLAAESLRDAGVEVDVSSASALGVAGGLGEALSQLTVAPADVSRAREVLGLPFPSSSAAAAASNASVRRPLGLTLVIGSLLGVCAIFGVRMLEAQRLLNQTFSQGPYGAPSYDGPCTVWPWIDSGRIATAACDLDDDGSLEIERTFSDDGAVVHESLVPDGRGRPREWTAFDTRGVPILRDVDANRDGNSESMVAFNRAGAEASRAFDDDDDGRTDRWVQPLGALTHLWRDRDGDGLPDAIDVQDESGRTVQRLEQTATGWTLSSTPAP